MPVSSGQWRGGEAVRADAEQHGQPDDGDGVIGSAAELFECDEGEVEGRQSAGPNQPTNGTVFRSRPAPIVARATGTMRTRVRLSTAYNTM
ncbi:MAG TPA: hypothetical protein VK204_02785 [Nocardioidaceae bacterium]|nr:hypothetical protein [Nocardioidaceae bacterium]